MYSQQPYEVGRFCYHINFANRLSEFLWTHKEEVADLESKAKCQTQEPIFLTAMPHFSISKYTAVYKSINA